MLTDLEWMGTGKAFPPESERQRLDGYAAAAKLFDGKHKDVFGADFARLADYLKKRNVDVNTVVNYPQLLTKKTADFVCGEPPVIDVGAKTDALNDLLDGMDFARTLYEAVIDVSRFGNAPVKALADRISIIPPMHWFPIVDKYDLKHTLAHVIAFAAEDEIYAEIHEPGRYEARRYAAEADADGRVLRFGALLSSQTQHTGADDCAVKVLANVGHSGSVYGMSDYGAIADILRQLMWRLYCMDVILDKHSMPTMSGPPSALSEDPVTGRKILVTGNFFKREREDDPKLEYLTWDGNLQAVQWEIEWLTNQLYTLSEMGAAFLEGAGHGEANSGRALRLRMTSPLIKARRIAGINMRALKQIVRLAGQAHGLRFEVRDISVTWKDGLPNDMAEQCEIFERATGGRPFMSQLSAVRQFGGFDDAAAEEELALIDAGSHSVFEPMELSDEQDGRTDAHVPGGAG